MLQLAQTLFCVYLVSYACACLVILSYSDTKSLLTICFTVDQFHYNTKHLLGLLSVTFDTIHLMLGSLKIQLHKQDMHNYHTVMVNMPTK